MHSDSDGDIAPQPPFLGSTWPSILWGLNAVAIIACGCANPMNTAFPVFQAQDPRTEAERYERFNPFPSGSVGPDVNALPPDSNARRSETRSAQDAALARGSATAAPGPLPGWPAGAFPPQGVAP